MHYEIQSLILCCSADVFYKLFLHRRRSPPPIAPHRLPAPVARASDLVYTRSRCNLDGGFGSHCRMRPAAGRYSPILSHVALSVAVLVFVADCAHASFLRGTPAVQKIALPAAPKGTIPSTGIDGYDDVDGGLTNICECKCCIETSPGSQKCYETSKLMFEVRKCTICDAQRCMSNFSNVCTARASLVKALCVERRSWFMRLVPCAFVVATCVLIGYALVAPKKDPTEGYWAVREVASLSIQHSRNILKDVPPAQLQTPLDPIRSGRESPRTGARSTRMTPSEQSSLLESAADALRKDVRGQPPQAASHEWPERRSPLSRSSTPPRLSLSTVPEIDEEEERETEFGRP